MKGPAPLHIYTESIETKSKGSVAPLCLCEASLLNPSFFHTANVRQEEPGTLENPSFTHHQESQDLQAS